MVKFQPGIPVKKICEIVSGSFVRGGSDAVIDNVAEPAEAQESSLAFIISESFLSELATTQARTVVISANLLEKASEKIPTSIDHLISCSDAYLGLARVSEVVIQQNPHWDWAKKDATGPISERVVIGEGTRVLPGAIIGPDVSIGRDCVIYPGVVIYPRTTIGDRVRIHANSVLGADGFGYARTPTGAVKIWHLGRVCIGNDVEIGAGAMIDRGTIKDTVVESGAKIDNLVQIGHNGYVKAHAIICAQSGLAGNVTVGKGAILAGNAGIADKVVIGDGAIVGARSGISKDVPSGVTMMGGQPSRPQREWWRLLALFDRLPELYDRVKKLEKGHPPSRLDV